MGLCREWPCHPSFGGPLETSPTSLLPQPPGLCIFSYDLLPCGPFLALTERLDGRYYWTVLESSRSKFQNQDGPTCGLVGTLSAHSGRGLLCLGGAHGQRAQGLACLFVCLLRLEGSDRLCLSAEGSEGEKSLSSEWWEDEAGVGG